MKALEILNSIITIISIGVISVGLINSCEQIKEAEKSQEQLEELQKDIEKQIDQISGLIDEPKPEPVIRDVWS